MLGPADTRKVLQGLKRIGSRFLEPAKGSDETASQVVSLNMTRGDFMRKTPAQQQRKASLAVTDSRVRAPVAARRAAADPRKPAATIEHASDL